MASTRKWIAGGLCAVAAVAACSYGYIIYEQGRQFDARVTELSEMTNNTPYKFKVTVDKKSFFGREISIKQYVYDIYFAKYAGKVRFGWRPNAVLTLDDFVMEPRFNKAVKEANPLITVDFNARFLPETINYKSDKIRFTDPWGEEAFCGVTRGSVKVGYANGLTDKEIDVDRIEAKLFADGYRFGNESLGEFELSADYRPKEERYLSVDFTEEGFVDPDVRFQNMSFKSDFFRKDGKYTQRMDLKADGRLEFLKDMGADASFRFDSDFDVFWDESIPLHKMAMTFFFGDFFLLDKEARQTEAGFADGRVGIDLRKFTFDASQFVFDMTGTVGARSKDEPKTMIDMKPEIMFKKKDGLDFQVFSDTVKGLPEGAVTEEEGKYVTNFTVVKQNRGYEAYLNGVRVF